LRVSGIKDHSGLRSGVDNSIATQTAAPMNGNLSDSSGYSTLMMMFAAIAAIRMKATMPTRAQSMTIPRGGSCRIGE